MTSRVLTELIDTVVPVLAAYNMRLDPFRRSQRQALAISEPQCQTPAADRRLGGARRGRPRARQLTRQSPISYSGMSAPGTRQPRLAIDQQAMGLPQKA